MILIEVAGTLGGPDAEHLEALAWAARALGDEAPDAPERDWLDALDVAAPEKLAAELEAAQRHDNAQEQTARAWIRWSGATWPRSTGGPTRHSPGPGRARRPPRSAPDQMAVSPTLDLGGGRAGERLDQSTGRFETAVRV